MRITKQQSVMEAVRDITITVAGIAGTVLLIGLVPKAWRQMEAIIASTSADTTLKMADAVRQMSLAKTYDLESATKAMLALPRISAK